MSTRAHKNRRTKKSRYLLLAALGLLSLIAYTTHYNSPKEMNNELVFEGDKHKSKALKQHEIFIPFSERWQQAQTDIENYLMDDGFKKTRYFFEGYNVASNDEFVLPNEETGAGNGTEHHIQDLSDAIVADLVPTGYSAGGSSVSGGGAGGAGGGGAGGGRRENNRAQYVALEDLQEDGNSEKTEGGSSDGGVSAVPVPPAIWLMSSALIGLLGLRRK